MEDLRIYPPKLNPSESNVSWGSNDEDLLRLTGLHSVSSMSYTLYNCNESVFWKSIAMFVFISKHLNKDTNVMKRN